MKNKLLLLSAFLILIFISMACNTDVLVIPVQKYQPPNDVRKIISLAQGQSWIYRSEFVIPGECVDTFPYIVDCYGPGILTRTIIDTQTYDGMFGYVITEQLSDTTGTQWSGGTNFEVVDSTSYVRYTAKNPDPELPQKLLEAPLIVGHRWESDPVFHDTLRITSIDTSMRVRGTWYYHGIYAQGIFSANFIVPGIGVVYEEGHWGLFNMDLIRRNF